MVLLKRRVILTFTALQREILVILPKIPDNEMFYLTGGIALADFFLAPRKSYDLDIFSAEKI